MKFKDLPQFIDFLEKNGELIRIKEPVSTYLEMTEIGGRLVKEEGPAMLLENVIIDHGNFGKGNSTEKSPYPVLINLFSSVKRVAFAMGTTADKLREVGETLAFLRAPEPPSGIKEAFGLLPLAKKLLSMKPKTIKKAPCQEIVITGDQIDLTALPIQTCWPGEPAPLITWPLVVTQGPNPKEDKTDNYNLGIYRMQLINKNQTLMRWLKHRGGAEHHRKWKKEQENKHGYEDKMSESASGSSHREVRKPSGGLTQKEGEQEASHSLAQAERRPTEKLGNFSGGKQDSPLPVAAVLGADPATILAAVTPVPDTLSEYDFAGLLSGEGIELVDCKTVPLKVPAHAEIVLEGFVSLDDYRDEGPYGDHTGYYNSVEPFPVFTCTAITMKKSPVFLTTYTGKPPDEPSKLGEALNEVFVPLLIQQFPEIVDFYLPPEGCSYRIGVVAIKKSYPGHAKRIMLGIWSYLRQFIYTKWLIVVDEDINIRDWKEVMWAISTRMDFGRDLTIIENTPIDYLDFASPSSGLGAKLGFDATNKIPPETSREWGKEIKMDEEIVKKIDALFSKIGL